MSVVIITGDVDSGKTTWLLNYLEGKRFCGCIQLGHREREGEGEVAGEGLKLYSTLLVSPPARDADWVTDTTHKGEKAHADGVCVDRERETCCVHGPVTHLPLSLPLVGPAPPSVSMPHVTSGVLDSVVSTSVWAGASTPYLSATETDCLCIGPHSLLNHTFSMANTHLATLCKGPIATPIPTHREGEYSEDDERPVLVIDEIGPLELKRGKGLREGLIKVLGGYREGRWASIVISCRDRCVSALRDVLVESGVPAWDIAELRVKKHSLS
ncbi:hypothetical protein KIPB_011054 [Kipferlia bialata]|uniref:P-loop containing nucleoside triphosphate hydrolase n=1 Tax=Kipferlia bialata TaxID=797122 RepID=A0A391NSK1_9EUKA|nr:hypothetical protein KIPB_011054 [Kipferlia bialata]|eukprot:g11054.t1